MPNSRYDPADSRYWEEPESDEDLDESYYFADDSDEEEEESAFDCGFVPGNGCQLAGTEDCNWECPYSHKLYTHSDYPNVTLTIVGNVIIVVPMPQ